MHRQNERVAPTDESRWAVRAQRCRQLAKSSPATESILDFYAAVLDFEDSVARDCAPVLLSEQPFLEQLDLPNAEERVPELLRLVSETGPEVLSRRAKQLQHGDPTAVLRGVRSDTPPQAFQVADFFRRACFQPLAEHLQLQMSSSSDTSSARCPVCGGLPQLSILRPEGEGGARWLQCSLCLKEWLFRRVVCPWCGEENKERLPRYSAGECAHVHVSACDVCERYLKSVDMTIEGRAVPLVDEVAMAVLDVWAAERGYQKIMPNLMGF